MWRAVLIEDLVKCKSQTTYEYRASIAICFKLYNTGKMNSSNKFGSLLISYWFALPYHELY